MVFQDEPAVEQPAGQQRTAAHSSLKPPSSQSQAAKAKQPQHTHTDTPLFLPCHTLQRDWAFYKDAQEKMVQAKQMILEMGAAAKRKEAAKLKEEAEKAKAEAEEAEKEAAASSAE